ncbi:MAG TPA: helix-turn-helix domain-containing protein [Methylocystis sp.]|jgi:phage terminase Nu1 subunit (DNA packaging protein)
MNKPAEAATSRQLVNERRAAEILGLQVKTLQEWRTSGKGCPFVKIGRAVRYSLADLDAFIVKNTVQSTTEADARKRAS